MKKAVWILVGLMMFVVLFTGLVYAGCGQKKDSVTFHIKVRVCKYVSVNPNFPSGIYMIGSMSPPQPNPAIMTMEYNVAQNMGNPGSYKLYAQYYSAGPSSQSIAYANCPLKIMITGNNPAGDGYPILARKEQGKCTKCNYDRLQTGLSFRFWANGGYPCGDWTVLFGALGGNNNAGGWYWGGNSNPANNVAWINEAPHDGQVYANFKAGVNFPHATPYYSSGKWWKSADAGKYKARIKLTFIAQ